MSNNLIKNLKELRSAAAEPTFKADLGARLEARMEALKAPVGTGVLEGARAAKEAGWAFGGLFRAHSLARVVAVATCVLMVVGGGSVVTVSAAQNSLPGDFLYGVKIAKEKVQTAVVTSSESKVKLKLTFAENRLNEAKTLASKNEPGTTEKIAQAVKGFQQEISEAEEHLGKLKEEKGIVIEDAGGKIEVASENASSTFEKIKNTTTVDVVAVGNTTSTEFSEEIKDTLNNISNKVAAYQATLNELKMAVNQTKEQECASSQEVKNNLTGVMDSALASSEKLNKEVEKATASVSSTSSTVEEVKEKPVEAVTSTQGVKKPLIKKQEIEVQIDLPTPERSDNVDLKLDTGSQSFDALE